MDAVREIDVGNKVKRARRENTERLQIRREAFAVIECLNFAVCSLARAVAATPVFPSPTTQPTNRCRHRKRH